jgi:hypothetical protein
MTNKPQVIASPKGVARYPWLTQPDYDFAEKFNSAPEYKCQLVLNKADSEAFKAQLTKIYQEAYNTACQEEGKKLKQYSEFPWVDLEDPDTGEATGETAFKFKLKATGENRRTGKTWENRIAWLNASRQPMEVPMESVGGGSVIRIAFEPYTWNAPIGFGLTLRIKIVQLIDHKTYVTNSDELANKLFDVEGDGFPGVEDSSDSPATDSGADF